MFGQGFYDATAEQGISLDIQNTFNGSGLSVYDFNNDGWDDLTLCTPTGPMKFYLNNQGQLEEITAPVSIQGNIKCAIWADYDNDHDNDLLVTRSGGTTALFKNIGDLQFEDISATSGIPQNTSALTYGASWGDYDRDGLLDLYICNYNWPAGVTNWLLHNEGNDTFNLVLAPVNDGFKRSFQAAFVDINHDLIPEIHVINDKFLGNSLYEFGVDGIWSDISFAWNAALEMESMSNSVSDFDHDADLDIYISNSQNGNALQKNNGNSFSDVGPQLGIDVNKLCWGSLWIDAENDSWEDLYISDTWPQNELNNFFKNNNGTFSLNNQSLGLGEDETGVYACAKGDFNNDGFQDFVTVGQYADGTRIWMNQGLGGNYFSLDLQGTISNADGIGSWITLYAGEEVLSHYSICGDNYLSQNTHRVHFGLSNIETIDSLVIQWPSGIENVIVDPEKNQMILFTENELYESPQSDSITICPGSCAVFSATGDEVVWDDGALGSIREVCEEGIYGYQINVNGIWYHRFLYAISAPDPEWTIETSNITCHGENDGSFLITTELDFDIVGIGIELWTSLIAGTYQVVFVDSYNCNYNEEFTLEQPEELSGQIMLQHVSCFGDSTGLASIDVLGGTLPYEINWSDNPESLPAGNYSVTITDSNGCSIENDFTIEEPTPLQIFVSESDAFEGNNGSAEITIEGGNPPYNIAWSNGDSQIVADSLAQGEYSVLVTDSLGCQSSTTFSIIDLYVSEASEEMVLFPNPTKTWVFIPGTNLELRLFDSKGSYIKSFKSGYCDLTGITPGNYILMNKLSKAKLIILP